MQLRPYQVECINNVFTSRERHKNIMIVLATWLWKTVISANIISQLIKKTWKKVLFIAHREELLKQTCEKMNAVDPEILCSIEQWENHASGFADLIVASVQTIQKQWGRIGKFNPDDFCLVVVDETHHIMAPSYKSILKYFQTNPEIKLLWLTATPDRADKKDLMEIFSAIAFEYPLIPAIKDKWLTDIQCFTCKTNVDISHVKTSMWDYAIWELSKAVNTPERNAWIAKTYKDKADWESAVAFCVDVQHAKDLCTTFNNLWIKSECIIWDTPSEERQRIYTWFRNWEIKVMTNVLVATEWWDEPCVTTLLMARPTQSRGLFTQMIGRWIRLHEWKESCKVFDFTDNTKKLSISMANIAGFEWKVDMKGKKLTKVKDKIDELMELAPWYAWELDLDDINNIIESYDIMQRATLDQEVSQNSKNARIKVNWGYELSLAKDANWQPEFISVLETMVWWKAILNWLNVLAQQETHIQALDFADKRIKWNRSDKWALVNATWSRRYQPASDAQLWIIKKRGYRIPYTWLTKGAASNILSHLFKK